jgi:hypothetical protein
MKIQVTVEWTGNNYSCVTNDAVALNGVIVVVNKTLDGLKKDFRESLSFHIEGCLRAGDELHESLIAGTCEIEYILEVSALLHSLERVITRSALSKITKISAKQLEYYASGIREPRSKQRQRIIDGIHQIGRELLSIV